MPDRRLIRHDPKLRGLYEDIIKEINELMELKSRRTAEARSTAEAPQKD